MRIENNFKISSLSKKKLKSSEVGDFDALLELEEPSSKDVTKVASTNFFLSLQEINDETSNDELATKNGQDILDRLDQIKLGLLAGKISKNNLIELENFLNQQQQLVVDPKLQSILKEIELRAAVEMAKLESVNSKRF